MGKNNIMVYHRKFGNGIVLGNENDNYIISFKGELKYIPSLEMGKNMFIKGESQSLDNFENYEGIDNNILIYPFFSNEIIEDKESNSKNAIKNDEKTNNIEVVNNTKTVNYVKRIEVLDGSEYRNIVIIDISTVTFNNKSFLRIIGLDILTSTVVSIVDTNGKQYGLYNNTDEFKNIRNNTVIKARFKYEPLDKFTNVLRISSEFSVIGESDLNKLRIKYNDLDYCNFITSFEEISEMVEEHKNKEFYCITHFTGSEVKKEKDKNNYQLKAGRFAANINNKMDVSVCEGLKFRGHALMSCIKNTDYKYPFIKILRLSGSYLTNSDYNFLKSKMGKKEFDGFNDDDQNYNEMYDESNSETYEDSLELMSYNRQRLWEESGHYTEEGYTSNYIEDGCDDSYFEEWKEDSRYESYDDSGRSFIEPGSEWKEDYWDDDEDYEEQFENIEEYKPSEEELKKWEEFNKNYKYTREFGMYSCNIYKIEDITDDAFAINFEKIKKPNQEVNELDIEDIPF